MSAADRSVLRTAADLTRLGPFFAVDVHPVDVEATAPWRPMATLLDAESLAARVARVRSGLATLGAIPVERVEARVAASVAHLGIVARLVSPALAAHVFDVALDLSRLSALWWRDELGGALPVSAVPAGPPALEAVVGGAVAPLTEAFERFGVPPTTLRGNVASALNSAFVQLAAATPETAARASAIVEAALALPALQNEPGQLGPAFRRHSCCLIYRLAPDSGAARYCGDCVLGRPA